VRDGQLATLVVGQRGAILVRSAGGESPDERGADVLVEEGAPELGEAFVVRLVGQDDDAPTLELEPIE